MGRSLIFVAGSLALLMFGLLVAQSGVAPSELFNGWSSSQQIQNIGAQPATIGFFAYDQDGNAFNCGINHNIPAGGSVNYHTSDCPVEERFVGSASVSANQDIVGMTSIVNAPVGSAAGQYISTDHKKIASTLYFPIAKHDFFGRTTTFAVRNIIGTADVVATFATDSDTFATTYEDVPPNGMVIISPADAGVPAGRLGSLSVTSDNPLAGASLEHEHAVAVHNNLQAYHGLTPLDGATTVYCPLYRKEHTARRFTTGATVQNIGDDPTTVEMTFRYNGGQYTESQTIAPNESYTFFAGAINEIPPNALGSVVFESSEPIVAVVSDRGFAVTPSPVTAYACFSAENVTNSVALPLYKEYFGGNSSGLQIQNVGDGATTTVAVTYLPAGGDPVTLTYNEPVAPGESVTFFGVSAALAPTGIAGGEALRATYGGAIVNADQPIVAIASESSFAAGGSNASGQDSKMYEGFNIGGSIAGTITLESGTPVSQTEVALYDEYSNYVQSVLTDDDGNYRHENLASGEYRVEAVDGYNDSSRYYPNSVLVSTSSTTEDIDIVLRELGTISGMIYLSPTTTLANTLAEDSIPDCPSSSGKNTLNTPQIYLYQVTDTHEKEWNPNNPQSSFYEGGNTYCYTIEATADITYKVGISFADYQSEYHENKYWLGAATQIALDVNDEKIINFELEQSDITISGMVTNTDGVGIGGIHVIPLYSPDPSSKNIESWHQLGPLHKAESSEADGTYQLNNLSDAGWYKIYFLPDDVDMYFPTYYPNKGFDDATAIDADMDSLTDINVTLGQAMPPLFEFKDDGSHASSDYHFSTDHDSNTGQVVIRGDFPEQGLDPLPEPLTLFTEVICSSGFPPYQVEFKLIPKLTVWQAFLNQPSFFDKNISSIPTIIGDIITIQETRYQVEFDLRSKIDNPDSFSDLYFDIQASWKCSTSAGTEEITRDLGELILHDPSGYITDSVTGEPIEQAMVVLHKVPYWRPRTRPSDNAPNTCQSHNSKEEGDPWDQPAPVEAGIFAIPDLGEISPQFNPQYTDARGHYGWDVAFGCWYVVVHAKGYVSLVSPVVGVPPEVTDLDLALTPFEVMVEPTDWGLRLEWPHLGGETRYEVWRGIEPDFQMGDAGATLIDTIISADDSTISFVDESIPALNNRYYYIIRARDEQKTVATSDTVGLHRLYLSVLIR